MAALAALAAVPALQQQGAGGQGPEALELAIGAPALPLHVPDDPRAAVSLFAPPTVHPGGGGAAFEVRFADPATGDALPAVDYSLVVLGPGGIAHSSERTQRDPPGEARFGTGITEPGMYVAVVAVRGVDNAAVPPETFTFGVEMEGPPPPRRPDPGPAPPGAAAGGRGAAPAAPALAQQDPQSAALLGGSVLVEARAAPGSGGGARLAVEFLDPDADAHLRHVDYRLVVFGPDGVAFAHGGLQHTTLGAVLVQTGITAPGAYEAAVAVEGVAFEPVGPEAAVFGFAVGGAAAPGAAPPAGAGVSTDRLYYGPGDAVSISGRAPPGAGGAATVLVEPPDGPPAILRPATDAAGSFGAELTAGTPPLAEPGPYGVHATGGGPPASAALWVSAGAAAPRGGADVLIPPGTHVTGCEAAAACSIPEHVTVSVGQSVTWTNGDAEPHTVTSGSPRLEHDGLFDSGIMAPGESFSRDFRAEGDYQYYCLIHPWREGMVTVAGDGPARLAEPTVLAAPARSLYDAGDTVRAWIRAEGRAGPHEVGVRAEDPHGAAVLDRTVATDYLGRAAVDFRIPPGSPPGRYSVEATYEAGGREYAGSGSFEVQHRLDRVRIGGVGWAGPDGGPAGPERGRPGSVVIEASADRPLGALVVATLFDSMGTAVAVAYARATLEPGGTEVVLPMGVPEHAAPGPGTVRVSALTGWPADGGVPYSRGACSAVEVG